MPTANACVSCCRARSCPSPPDLALLRAIATAPRATGGNAIADARARCAHELTQLGFTIEARTFEYSGAPGLAATPIAGMLIVLLALGVTAVARTESRFGPLVLLIVGSVVIGAGARWLTQRGVLDAPWLRRTGTNLVATRGDAPAVWLVAHIDTKSQLVPTLVRSVGALLTAIGLALLFAVSVHRLGGETFEPRAQAIALWVTIVGTSPLLLSIVGDRSPGAFDNASGVATVVEAARILGDVNVGVLITDAEELGLAGARALARKRGPGGVYLNCDGVDDMGSVVVMYSRRIPDEFRETLRQAAASCGVSMSVRRMLPGLLTDSVAFADAGAVSATFSRGTIWSLARVHSARDDLSRLRGTGIAETAGVIAATVRGIRGSSEHTWKS